MEVQMREKIEAITDPNNWRPNISKIAEETGKSIKTIKAYYDNLRAKGMLKIEITNISEIDALLNKQVGGKNGGKK